MGLGQVCHTPAAAPGGVLQKNPLAHFLTARDLPSEETQGPGQFRVDETIRGLCQHHLGEIGRVDPAEARAIQGRLQVGLLRSEVAGQQMPAMQARQKIASDCCRRELMEEAAQQQPLRARLTTQVGHVILNVLENPQFYGAVQVIGGVGEAGVGALTWPLGAPIAIHGIDQVTTGVKTITFRKHQKTITEQLLHKVGLSQQVAAQVDVAISLVGMTGGAAAALRTGRAAQVSSAAPARGCVSSTGREALGEASAAAPVSTTSSLPIATRQRALKPEDIGIPSRRFYEHNTPFQSGGSSLWGTIALKKGGVLDVKVKHIQAGAEGLLGNGLTVIAHLKHIAKTNGATTLRVRADIANERILELMHRRFGKPQITTKPFHDLHEIEIFSWDIPVN